MPTTYTTNKLRLEEPSNGSYVNQWDIPVNTNWEIIDASQGSFSPVPLTQGNYTLGPLGVGPTANYSYQNLGLVLQGSLTGDCVITIPAGVGGFWIVQNQTSGSYTVTIRSASGGATLVVPTGFKASMFCDGSNVYATNSIGSFQTTGGLIEGNVTIRDDLNDMKLYIGPSNSYIYGSSQFIGISNDNTTLGALTFNIQNGNLTTSGNVTAYSDARLKKDVRTIRNALDRICACRGVEYTRIDTGERDIGVIAQEIEQHFPDVVHKIHDETNAGTLSVSYGSMVAPIIEAIKELNARLTAIEGKLR